MTEPAASPLGKSSRTRGADLAPEAEALAALVAQFAEDRPIPWDVLRTGAAPLPPPLADITTDAEWDALAESLRRAGIVTVETGGINLTADTAERILAATAADEAPRWNRLALGLIDSAFPQESARYAVWTQCDRLVDHARAVIGRVPAQTAADESDAVQVATGLLARVVAYLLARGQLAAARDSFQLAENFDRRAFLADAAALTAFMRVTADLLMMEDRVDAATGVLRDALDSDVRARPGSVDEAQDRIALAHAYAESNDLDRALTEARASLALLEAAGDQPTDVVAALLKIGWILSEQGEHTEALALIKRARELAVSAFGPNDPETVGSGNDLALALVNAGKLEEARPILEATLRDLEAIVDPGHPKTCVTHSNLGYVLLELGDPAAAFTHCKAALDAAIQTFPKNHQYRLSRRRGLVRCLNLLGDGDAEREQRERLVEETAERYGIEAPETNLEIQQLARVCHAVGDLDAAVRFYEAAILHLTVSTDDGRRVGARLLVDLALALRAAGRTLDAVGACSRSLELLADIDDDAERLRPRLALAGLLHSLESQLVPAMELLDHRSTLRAADTLNDLVSQALAASPTDLDSCVQIAGICTEVGAFDASAAALASAVAIPDRPAVDALEIAAAFRVLGDALANAKRPTDAEHAWRSALGLLEAPQPLDPAVARERWLTLRALGYHYDGRGQDERGDAEDALEWMKKAVEASRGTGRPQDLAVALTILGRGLTAHDRAADAIPVLREALAVSELVVPRDEYGEGVRLHDLGRALMNDGNAPAALGAFELALERKRNGREHDHRSDNDIAVTATAFARVLRESGRADEAVAVLSDVAKNLSDESARDREIAASAFAELGLAHDADGNPDAAATAFHNEVRIREQLLDADPLFWSMHRLGRTLEGLGRLDTALTTYRRALALTEQIAPRGDRVEGIVLHDIGDVLAGLGQREEATEAYRHALERKRAAASTASDDRSVAVTMLSLGRSLISAKRWDEARAVLSEQLRALRSWTTRDAQFEGVTLHDIAEVHEGSGDLDAAIDAYREAADRKRESEKDPEDLAFTLAQLAAALRRAGRDDEANAAEAEAAAVDAP